MNTVDWGLTDYKCALEKQLDCVQKRREKHILDTLIFTEHYPTFTLGARKESSKHLLWTKEDLLDKNISLIQSNRGGDITYHGPGQLVAYTIIDLSKNKDLHLYLRNLEQVLINSLLVLGIQATRKDGKTGIWVADKKLAAIGIAVKNWITYHGFALNVNNDLSPFNGIIPCGINKTEGTVGSLSQELGKYQDINYLKQIIQKEFWAIFTPEV